MASSKRDHAALAHQYALDVTSGAVPAGKRVRQAAQRHLDDLAKDWAYYFAPDEGARVCRYIELLPHTKGKWAAKKQTIDLQPWQCFLIVVGFGWLKKKNDKRRFRVFYWEIPRKNGKSLLAGGIGNYMFTADREFGAEVYSGATTEKQAWEVFGPARLMMDRTPAFAKRQGVQVCAKTMVVPKNGSKFEPIIGNPGDGASPSCAIVDEFHEHDTPNMYDTMETGMGAREQPILLAITTAGTNIAGPCHDKHDEVCKMLDGVIENDEMFGVIFGIDSTGDEFTVQSFSSLERLGNVCNCGCVPTTRIAKLSASVFARLATTSTKGQQKQDDASITPTGPSETEGSAVLATNNSCLTETPNTREGNSQKGKNGRAETPKESSRPKSNIWQKLNLTLSMCESEEVKNFLACMERLLPNLNECLNSSPDDARYANVLGELYAWIIAIGRARLGASCADNVTLQSAFLEIVQAVLSEHSDTCNARKQVTARENCVVFNLPPDDWASPASLIKANPNYGISVDADFLMSQQRQAMQSPVKQATFKTKHLNVWTSVLAGAFNMQLWTLAKDALLSPEEFLGVDCWFGVDLASKSDLCSLQIIFRKEINGLFHYYWFGRYWLPEAAIEEPGPNHASYLKWREMGLLIQTSGATVDFAQITEEVIDLVKKYNPAEIVYDPFNATQMAQAFMEKDITVVEFIQQPQNFAVPMDEVSTALKDARLHHDGNEMTTWCMSNVVARPAKKGLFSPVKSKPAQKIDGAIAAIIATSRACLIPEPVVEAQVRWT